MHDFDYIIAGGGLAGLSLAYHMAQSSLLIDKTLLIIEKEDKNQNDRTWSFWETDKSPFESIVWKQWDLISNTYAGKTTLEPIAPFKYKTIRGIDFYNFVHQAIAQHPAISYQKAAVTYIDEHEGNVITTEGLFHANMVFDARFNVNELFIPQRYHDLKQHFYGQRIRANKPIFKPDAVTYMDMSIRQHEGLRFMYILPESETEALVEFTIFSENLLINEEYAIELQKYLYQLTKDQHEVLEEEFGIIPMTNYPFAQPQNTNYLKIGSAAGFAKPSTGYAFKRTQRYCASIVHQLENGKAPTIKHSKWFMFMDAVLLRVMKMPKVRSAVVFQQLYENTPMPLLLKFLDEQTNWKETLRVMQAVPIFLFIKATLKEYFRLK
jgi:lycopene beta-cyclase